MDHLERYRPIVDDFEAFLAACRCPLPMVVRVNTTKTTPARVRTAFDREGIGYEGIDWHDGLLALEGDSPGANWPYYLGWIHGQEEVSALPPIALDPAPGEVVWDAAAAPGSKATQIAALMEDRGRLVANDKNLGRLSSLRSNAERLGITNVAVTNGDARNYSLKPFGFEAFDRALADVPCTCEGTIRKNPDALEDWSEEYLSTVAGVQRGILRRAVQATREGGVVVYSTCTFAPEENEAVLDHVLETEDCRVVDVDLPLRSTTGVTEWDGAEYDPQVREAHRVYPHHNDTGGFFLAKLEVGA